MIDKRNFYWPMVAGEDQSVDYTESLGPRRTSIVNGQYLKDGSVDKRPGFSNILTGIIDSSGKEIDSGRGIFSTGKELCVITKERLYGRLDTGEWADRGQVSPFSGKEFGSFSDGNSNTMGDLFHRDGYMVEACQRQYRDTTKTYRGIAWRVLDSEGNDVLPDIFDTGIKGEDPTAPHSPLCASKKDGLLVAFITECAPTEGAAAQTLKVYEWPTSTPSKTQPALVWTSPIVVFSQQFPQRTYDIIPVLNTADGCYLVAYITESQQTVWVDMVNSSNVTVAQWSWTLPPETGGMKLVTMSETKTGTNRIVLSVVVDPTIGNDYINNFELRVITTPASESISTVSGPVTDAKLTANGGYSIISIGNHCLLSTENPGVTNHICPIIWSESAGTYGAGTFVYTTRKQSVNPAGLAVQNDEATLYNCLLRTRPWSEDGRVYNVCHSRVSSVLGYTPITSGIHTGTYTQAFDSTAVVRWYCEINNPLTGNTQPNVVGLLSVGTAPAFDPAVASLPWDAFVVPGAGNHVSSPASGVWECITQETEYFFGDKWGRYGQYRMHMDWNRLPTYETLNDGCAVIGGGFVAYYDGEYVYELGWATMPMIHSITPTDGGGHLLDNNVYYWSCAWFFNDPAGYLHRGAPSSYASINVGGAGGHDNLVTILVRTNPFSNRIGVRRAHLAVWHSGGGYENAVRCIQPLYGADNYGGANTVSVADYGDVNAEVIYNLVEIEAVAPEGAEIVSKVGTRLYFGRMWRGERLQFTKPLASGSSSEQKLAPETNEGFGFKLPGIEDVGGIASLDGNASIFSLDQVFVNRGYGPTDAGGNDDFSGPIEIQSDTGCIYPRSVVDTPVGAFFMGKRGLMMLGRDGSITFIGKKVMDWTASFPVVTSAVLVPEKSEVRFTCLTSALDDAIIVVYNYLLDRWVRWDIDFEPTGACLHGGVYHCVDAAGKVWKEDYATGYDVVNSWAWGGGAWSASAVASYVEQETTFDYLSPAEKGGWVRFSKASILARAVDAHDVEIEEWTDYENTTSLKTHTWEWDPADQFMETIYREQPFARMIRQKCQSKRLIVRDVESVSSVTGRGMKLKGMTVQYGLKKGTFKGKARQQG